MALPSGYKQLKYIQSTGTQYINTGFKPNQDTRVVADMQIVTLDSSLDGNSFWGARTTNKSLAYGFSYNISKDQIQQFFVNTSAYSVTPSSFYDRQIWETNKNVLSGNDVSNTMTYSAFQCAYNLYLFAMNQKDSAIFYSRVKMYSCQVYDNGTLIRDYVPAMREADRAVGLYDRANDVFYTSAGTDAFVAKLPPAKLPAGYTRLEYIQSSGTQRIDTGFKPNQDTRTTVVAASTEGESGTYPYLFGCDSGYGSVAYEVSTWTAGFGSNTTTTTFNWADGQAHTIDFNKGKLYIDGALKWSASATVQTTCNLNIMALNRIGTYYFFKGKVYSCQIYDGSTLIRDFVPALRSSDNVVGLYDVVNGVFYTNAGSGTLVAGPVARPTGSRTLLDGTDYAMAAGTVMVSGTIYEIVSGKVLQDGTVYSLAFGSVTDEPVVPDEPAVPDNTITFTIDGVTYTADKGMTWGNWVKSSYNTGGFWVPSGSSSVYSSRNQLVWHTSYTANNTVKITQTIVANRAYKSGT